MRSSRDLVEISESKVGRSSFLPVSMLLEKKGTFYIDRLDVLCRDDVTNNE